MAKTQLQEKTSFSNFSNIKRFLCSSHSIIVVLSLLLLIQIVQNQLMLQRSRNVFDQSTPLLVGTKINLPSLQTSQGESYNFSNQENQRYMILYFRTDCKFCHLDLPLWKEIHSQSTHLNTNVIAITEESDIDLVSAFANENDLPFPVLMDPEHKLLGQLKFPVTPTKVLISDEQRVAQVWRGLTTQQSGDADVGGLVATFGIEPTLLPQSADVNIR